MWCAKPVRGLETEETCVVLKVFVVFGFNISLKEKAGTGEIAPEIARAP